VTTPPVPVAFGAKVSLERETTMTAKDDVKVMVLTDLAAICKKLSEEPAVPKHLRDQAAKFVAEYDSLVQYRGSSENPEHFRGEALLVKIGRFMPRIADEMTDTNRDVHGIGSTV
jgi:hypothetical protein